MDANLHANIMNSLMLTVLVLVLAIVWVLTRWVKWKAIYVYHLQQLLWRLKQ